jgi:DNA repair exonuclease SbcCD nuclease subunit
MLITLFSDIHILKNPKPTYREITENWFNRFIEETSSKSDILFFLGDWHDNDRQIAVDDLHFSNKCFSILKEHFKEIHMIPGNHDCYFRNNSSVNSISHFHDGKQVFVYEKSTNLNVDGVEFCFVPWGDESNICDVMLCHYDIQGFSLDNGKASPHGKTYNELFEKSPVVISGHYHRYQQKKYKNGTITYLGSPFELTYGEEGKESYFWYFDTTSKSLKSNQNNWSPRHYNIFMPEDLKGKEGNFIRVYNDVLVDALDRTSYCDVAVNIVESAVKISDALEQQESTTIDILDTIDIVVDGTNIPEIDKKEKISKKLKEYFRLCKK